MLSSNPLITETLALLLHHGIHDIVLCPGSRNAGIVHTVYRVHGFRTYTATDERSAGFMAIGLADARRGTADRGVAVVVTSGSALANLYPAACEAFYRHVPVAFISADRPAAWIGQMDGQTMPQAGALGAMTMMSVSLPGHDLWHANRLLNEALLCCTARRPQGPVHINIPIEEPIYDFTAPRLPEARTIRLCHNIGECFALPDRGDENTSEAYGDTHGRIPLLIVCGQLRPEEVPVEPLSHMQPHHCPAIMAENLSNLPPQLYTHADRVDWQRMPGVYRLVTVGGHIISKELKQHFRQHRPTEHWHVSEDGRVADLFRCQAVAVQASARDFFLAMAEQGNSPRQAAPGLTGKGVMPATEKNSPGPMEAKTCLPCKSHLAADRRVELLQDFFALLPEGSAVHLANSSSVRLAQMAMERWLDTAGRRNPAVPSILCNRGINGIEGSVSAAVGYALGRPGTPTYIITGDLSFFYDRNALWTSPLPPNLHILLLNDGGGSIFDTLPLPPGYPDSRRAITGTHHLRAEHTALLHGLLYLRGQDRLADFMRSTDAASILEVVCRI